MNLSKFLKKYLNVNKVKKCNNVLDILPYELVEKYNFLVLNNNFVSILCIKKHMCDISIFSNQNNLEASNIIVHTKIFKVDSASFLKKLHATISNVKSEKTQTGGEQIDIDVLDNMFSDAKKLRYLIQVKSQDVYEVETYLVISCKTEEELKRMVSETISVLYSNGQNAVPLNFRQKQGYLHLLPTLDTENMLHKNNCEIYTTDSLTAAFLFYQNNMLEENGVIIGYTNKNVCMLNTLCEYNNNKNMVVFGSSGAGKSYFVKNIILQYLYRGIKQIIIDPLGEYVKLSKTLGGKCISINNINIFEIHKSCFSNSSIAFQDKKIKGIIKIIGINESEELNIDEASYNKIYDNISEIYEKYEKYGNINTPPVYELKNILNGVILCKKTKDILQKKINNICNNYTQNTDVYNIENANINASENTNTNTFEDIVVYDVSRGNISEEYLKMVIFSINNSLDKGVLLYIDEMWQFLNYDFNIDLASIVSGWFKNIRHSNSGIVAITQDIADMLEFSNGSFGKSILNNSYTKVYFKMEYLDLDNLIKLIPEDAQLYTEIKKLGKGDAIIDYGSSVFNVKVKAFEYEDKLIKGEVCLNEENFNCNG